LEAQRCGRLLVRDELLGGFVMAGDDDFEPRLGRIRSTKGGRSARYLQGVLRGVARSTGSAKSRSSRFDGSRIGRASGVGRVLHARDRHAAFRARRVIVQARLIRLKATGANAARLHLRYLERDGVTREGLPGELYDAKQDAQRAGTSFNVPRVIATSSASSSRRKMARLTTISNRSSAG